MRALGIAGLLPLVFGAFILFRLFRGRFRASVEERRAAPAYLQFQTIFLNWNAHGVVAAPEMISASIQNICAFLRWWTGEPTETLPGLVAPADEDFEKPWADEPSITLLRRNLTITENHIDRLPEERLMEILQDRMSAGVQSEDPGASAGE